MRHLAAVAILAAAAGAARADEVVLRNGARFEGEVREGKDTVTVVMDFGTITFKRIDVARIDRGASALTEFDAKIAELKSDDLDGRYKLALWARHKGLDHRARQTFEEILVRDPEHAGAREALGYRKVEGRWLSEDEIRTARGEVLFRGEWISREVADHIRKIEAERAAESSRIAEVERLRIRVAEAEAAAYRAREDAARERATADYDDYYYRRPVVFYRWYANPDFSCRPRTPLNLGNVRVVFPGKCPPCAENKTK
jgi:hypothetical protein